MSGQFGRGSTTDDVLAGIDLTGKRIFLTGASAGLGIETARALVAHGAEVVGAVRDLAKAQAAGAPVFAAAAAGSGSFVLTELDLASLASVRACVDRHVADGRRFDAVIANAGVMATPQARTADGFETQFGTNHLGHFVLINGMIPLLRPGSRVVSLSSLGHRFADVDLDDPNFERTPYNDFAAYGRSKTANILFAVEFDRRHRGQGIRATAVHPGRIPTELSRYMRREDLGDHVIPDDPDEALAQGYKTIPQGAATTVWAAVTADADEVGGRYCEDCQVAGPAAAPDSPTGVQAYAVDPERARKLWTLSEALVSARQPAAGR